MRNRTDRVDRLDKFLIVFVLTIAAILRFWRLGEVPPSPNWDEVALGYNAYSILRTGRDEYGKFLPVILRSFDDYKPGLYAYLAIPPVALFGLSTWAVRLPAAIIGVLAVLGTYFLGQELFYRSNKTYRTYLPWLSAMFLAISPWHIQFSRVGFEAGVGLAFVIFGVLFFLKAMNSKLSFNGEKVPAGKKSLAFMVLSAMFFSLSLYTYQSEKVIVPLMLLFLVVVFRKEARQMKKDLLAGGIVFVVISSYFVYSTLTTPDAFLRAKGVSVFADQTLFLKQTAERLIRDQKKGDYLGLILDNRRFTYFRAFLDGYLSHFNLNWLFITGDHPRHHAPGMGLMYLWELPFLLVGIYRLTFGGFDKKVKYLVFGWVLITPIPAALTTDLPHAIRTIHFLPMFQVLVALGVLGSLSHLGFLRIKRVFKFLVCVFGFSFLVFNFSYYLNQYFVQQKFFYSNYWQYGYREAVEFVRGVQEEYEKIVVENRPHLDQSYMFFLFYFKYPPEKYLAEGATESGGFADEHRFGKYEFRPIDLEKEEKRGVLFVGRPGDFPAGANVLKTVFFLNGEEAIKIVRG